MQILENDFFKISVQNKGAELCSLILKSDNTELIWQGDPKFWNRHSPVLFPIVGALKNEQYIYAGNTYFMNQHGFARDADFELIASESDSLSYCLQSSETSKKIYPFDFDFFINHKLTNEKLCIGYKIVNRSKTEMLFSVGAHPAFNCPMFKSETYQDYYLEFEEEENINRWFIENKLLSARQTQILENEKKIPLNRRKFNDDALIFKNPKSNKISLKSGKSNKGIMLDFKGFDYLSIWAKPGADFVCIGPWNGITDNYDSNNIFEEKEGIRKLLPNETFECAFSLQPIL